MVSVYLPCIILVSHLTSPGLNFMIYKMRRKASFIRRLLRTLALKRACVCVCIYTRIYNTRLIHTVIYTYISIYVYIVYSTPRFFSALHIAFLYEYIQVIIILYLVCLFMLKERKNIPEVPI